MKFAKTEGVPLVVAMPAAMARQVIEELSAQLERLGEAPQAYRKH